MPTNPVAISVIHLTIIAALVNVLMCQSFPTIRCIASPCAARISVLLLLLVVVLVLVLAPPLVLRMLVLVLVCKLAHKDNPQLDVAADGNNQDVQARSVVGRATNNGAGAKAAICCQNVDHQSESVDSGGEGESSGI